MICNILQIAAIISLGFSGICAFALLFRAIVNHFDQQSDATLWQLLFTSLVTGGILIGSAYKLDCAKHLQNPISPQKIPIEKPVNKK
jgi:hypothetical protein